MAKSHNWISEQEAAEKLQRHYLTVRRKVVAGSIPISFRTINGRSYQYSETDIEKFLNTQTIYRLA